nr:unnamed protein product [Callosobruchus analis]CAI5867573.1 unnamed protein product [Callosobruchus analis]CAI5867576.1 unnamed protein product [Callosobruchus analis]CAI5869835.1 unnamed protein product [Callosobruchus analis]
MVDIFPAGRHVSYHTVGEVL